MFSIHFRQSRCIAMKLARSSRPAIICSLTISLFGLALVRPAQAACSAVITADCTNSVNASAASGAAAYFIVGNVTVTNTATGTLNMNSSTNGQGNYTIMANQPGSAFSLLNGGTISNTSTAGGLLYGNAITIDATGAYLVLNNSGTISTTTSPTNATFTSGVGVYVSSSSLFASIANQATGTISGKYYGVSLNGTGASSIDNRGTISGGNYGVQINSPASVTVTNRGIIGGNTASVLMQSGNNTFNIYDSAIFTKPLFFMNTNGNTINFYTGSYTLAVNGFKTSTNTINALGSGTQIITTGLNGAGTGNIAVVAPTVAPVAPAAVGNAVASASNVVNSVVNTAVNSATGSVTNTGINSVANTIVPPVQAASPEVSPQGRSNLGLTQADASSALSPAEKLRAGSFGQPMANLGSSAHEDLLSSRQGSAADSLGNLVWARGFGANRTTASDGARVGNTNNVYGFLVGYDRQFRDGRIGAYAGYGVGATKMLDATGTLATNYYLGGIYARRDFGAATILANFAAGVMDNQSTRLINLGAEQANGSFGGMFIAPELALSYGLTLAPGWQLTPTLRGRYVGAFMPGYTESGSTQNVSYDGNASHALEERAELKLTRTFQNDRGLASSVYGQVAALANQRIGSDSFNAAALGATFVVSNPYARSTFGGLIGLGLDHQISREISMTAGVDATLSNDHTTAYIGRASVRVGF